MVVVFAQIQVMIVEAEDTVIIFTDPVPLGNNDRASSILLMHYAFGGTTVGDQVLGIQTQISNDGVEWVDVGTAFGGGDPTATPSQDVRSVNGTYLRYKYSWQIAMGSMGAVSFDHHVKLEHS